MTNEILSGLVNGLFRPIGYISVAISVLLPFGCGRNTQTPTPQLYALTFSADKNSDGIEDRCTNTQFGGELYSERTEYLNPKGAVTKRETRYLGPGGKTIVELDENGDGKFDKRMEIDVKTTSESGAFTETTKVDNGADGSVDYIERRVGIVNADDFASGFFLEYDDNGDGKVDRRTGDLDYE